MDASAANTRTWPTRWISPGTVRLPTTKPPKYPAITSAIRLVGIPSIPPRTPSSVPCMPLPTISSMMPRSSGQLERTTVSMLHPVSEARRRRS